MSVARQSKFNLHIIPILLVLVIVGGGVYYLRYLRHGGEMPKFCPPKAANELRVGTVNIARFSAIKSSDLNAEFLLAAAKRNNLDVLVIQEYSEKYKFRASDFKAMFAGQYPYIHIDGEQAIVSRIPFKTEKYDNFNMEHGSYSSYLLRCSGGSRVRLISVHLHTTGISAMMRAGNVRVSDYSRVLKSSGKVRNYQADAIMQMVNGSEYPVIVAGDFNSMPLSKVYRTFTSAGLQDTFLKAGVGKGSTFRSGKNLLRIDYILPDNNFEVRGHVVCDDFISDHRLVIATLAAKASRP